jgi:hypothetical protein
LNQKSVLLFSFLCRNDSGRPLMPLLYTEVSMYLHEHVKSQRAELLKALLLKVRVEIAYYQTYQTCHRLVKMPVDVEFTLVQVVATVKMLPQSHT